MRIGCRIPILLVLLSCLLPAAQAEPPIFMPAMVPTPVRHAAHRLSELQGLVADIIWLPEALRMFCQRVDWMVDEYNFSSYNNNPYPGVVDRSIYPKATSKPVTLQPKIDEKK